MARVKRKTHKAAASRFRVTGKKRIRRSCAGTSHLMSTKSSKRRRRLRRGTMVETDGIAERLLRMLGAK